MENAEKLELGAIRVRAERLERNAAVENHTATANDVRTLLAAVNRVLAIPFQPAVRLIDAPREKGFNDALYAVREALGVRIEQ